MGHRRTRKPTADVVPAVDGAQSVARALAILQTVTHESPGVTAAAVVSRFGYSLPTANRLLRALTREGFMEFDRTTNQFRPGPEILRLTTLLLAHDRFIPRVYESLARLRDATGETATLQWRMGDSRSAVHELPSRGHPHLAVGLGRRYPLTRGAAGKAMLALVDEAEVRRVVDATSGSPPAAGLAGLRAELRDVRRTGVARSHGETIAGAASVATSLGWHYGGFAVLGVTGPAERFGPAQQDAAADALLAEARLLPDAGFPVGAAG